MPAEDVVPCHILWTAQQAAEYLNCSQSYVYKAAERDRLPAIRIGRMLRFAPDVVRTFATGKYVGG